MTARGTSIDMFIGKPAGTSGPLQVVHWVRVCRLHSAAAPNESLQRQQFLQDTHPSRQNWPCIIQNCRARNQKDHSAEPGISRTRRRAQVRTCVRLSRRAGRVLRGVGAVADRFRCR